MLHYFVQTIRLIIFDIKKTTKIFLVFVLIATQLVGAQRVWADNQDIELKDVKDLNFEPSQANTHGFPSPKATAVFPGEEQKSKTNKSENAHITTD